MTTSYAYGLLNDIPNDVFVGLASIFSIGLVISIAWRGFKTGLRYTSVLLLIEYVFLLFCSTVIYRTVAATRQYDFHLFSRNKAIVHLWKERNLQRGFIRLL